MTTYKADRAAGIRGALSESWASDARTTAHVNGVILGPNLWKAVRAEKHLFSHPDTNRDPEDIRHAALFPSLFEPHGLSAPHLAVREESPPTNGMSRLIAGSKPIDDTTTFSTRAERGSLLDAEPDAPFHGTSFGRSAVSAIP